MTTNQPPYPFSSQQNQAKVSAQNEIRGRTREQALDRWENEGGAVDPMPPSNDSHEQPGHG